MIAQLEIKMNNAAFESQPHLELARILRHLAELVERAGPMRQALYDVNGNRVGHFEIIEEK